MPNLRLKREPTKQEKLNNLVHGNPAELVTVDSTFYSLHAEFETWDILEPLRKNNRLNPKKLKDVLENVNKYSDAQVEEISKLKDFLVRCLKTVERNPQFSYRLLREFVD